MGTAMESATAVLLLLRRLLLRTRPSPTATPLPPTSLSSLLEALLLPLLPLLLPAPLTLLLLPLPPMPLASPTTPLTQATLVPSTPATLLMELMPAMQQHLLLLPMLLPLLLLMPHMLF